MINLTGKNSFQEIFSLSNDELTFFKNIAKESKVFKYKIKILLKKNFDGISISFFNIGKTHCIFSLNFETLKPELSYNKDSEKLVKILENSSNFNEIFTSLLNKKIEFRNLLKNENKLKFDEIEIEYDGDLKLKPKYQNYCAINFYLHSENSENSETYRMILRIDDNFFVSFFDCDKDTSRYILDNYEGRKEVMFF